MHITGGMLGEGRDQSEPGKVDVFRAADFVTYPDHSGGFDAAPIKTVTTTANGGFRISLAAGSYRLRGAPADSGDLTNSKPFTIKPGQTTLVDLLPF